jgi:lysyl oxidase
VFGAGSGGRAALVAVAAIVGAASAGATGSKQLLPDLDPDEPHALRTFAATAETDASQHVFLTFEVTINNRGAGPMIVRGHRPDASQPQMTADQVIRTPDRKTTTVPSVGRLTYDPDYERWGLEPYQTYELRSKAGALMRKAPQSSFCLEDNGTARSGTRKKLVLAGKPRHRVYVGCGKRQPNVLALDTGISVGWKNRHAVGKSGQMIEVTGLPDGTYRLVQRVNSTRKLHEARYTNNAASELLSLHHAGAASVSVRVVQACPDTPTCPAPT